MKKKILIVDDLYPNRYLLQEIFDDDYEVHSAADGDKMRELLKTMVPDIILMDINLPDQDGFELTKELKTSPSTKDIPVIFLTVRNTKIDVLHAINAGGSDFIGKPFDEQELKNRVEKVLKDKPIREISNTTES